MRLYARRWLAGGALAVLIAPMARAHVVETGFGPLIDTLVHMFVGPDVFLATLAAGLYCGLRSPEVARRGRQLYLYAWVVFYLSGIYLQYPFDYPYQTAVGLAAMGALVASDWALPDAAVFLLMAWLGGLFGLVGGGTTVGVQLSLVVAMGTADFLLLLGVFSLACYLVQRFPPARIGFRVAGSWITAVGMLQLGWTIRSLSRLP